MDMMEARSGKPTGLRERKRRETRQRIADKGLELFVKNGYEATTLEAIAEAAGISRRTFFYYFKSKEDVLWAWQKGGDIAPALRTAMLEESPDLSPLKTAQHALLKLASRYETKESIVVDRLIASNELLQARKEAVYVDLEQALVEAMQELWPAPEEGETVRIVSMMAMGGLRVARDNWRRDEGDRPLADYLRESFALMERQV